METLYQKIVQTFNEHPEVFTGRTLPVPRTIDIDYGQADDPEGFELFLPAVLLNFDIKAGTNNEPDLLTLDVTVLQEPGSGTESFSETRNSGLEYLRFLNAVKYCFNHLASGDSSPLQYAGERKSASPFFRFHVINYTCFIDRYTESLHKPVMAEGSIEAIRLTGTSLVEKKVLVSPEIETYGNQLGWPVKQIVHPPPPGGGGQIPG